MDGPITLDQLEQAIGGRVVDFKPPPPNDSTPAPFVIDIPFLERQREAILAQRRAAQEQVIQCEGALQLVDFLLKQFVPPVETTPA